MRCPISGAGLRGAGVAPAPCPPALWELRRRQPLLFPGMAELRPGETRVAAGSVVAPRWPAAPGGHRRVGSGLGRAGEGAQGWGGGPGLGPVRPPRWRAGRGTSRTAGPLVIWKNLGGSSSGARGPRRGVLQGRGPSPTGCARCPRAARTPPPPGRSPEPHGAGRRSGTFSRPGGCLSGPAGRDWLGNRGRKRSQSSEESVCGVGLGWETSPQSHQPQPSCGLSHVTQKTSVKP